jgi:hypothetical protein
MPPGGTDVEIKGPFQEHYTPAAAFRQTLICGIIALSSLTWHNVLFCWDWNDMKILAIGDIIGKPGRDAVKAILPGLKRDLGVNLVVANGENLAGGIGLTPSTAEELLLAGADVITSGNHIWAQKEIYPFLDGRSEERRVGKEC